MPKNRINKLSRREKERRSHQSYVNRTTERERIAELNMALTLLEIARRPRIQISWLPYACVAGRGSHLA